MLGFHIFIYSQPLEYRFLMSVKKYKYFISYCCIELWCLHFNINYFRCLYLFIIPLFYIPFIYMTFTLFIQVVFISVCLEFALFSLVSLVVIISFSYKFAYFQLFSLQTYTTYCRYLLLLCKFCCCSSVCFINIPFSIALYYGFVCI